MKQIIDYWVKWLGWRQKCVEFALKNMKTKKQQKMKQCCYKNIDKAIRKGRAWYVCMQCGKDVSILWFFYQLAVRKDEN